MGSEKLRGLIQPLSKIPYTCPWDLKLGTIVKWLKNFRTTSKVCRWRHRDVSFLLTSSKIRQIRQMSQIARTFQPKVVEKWLTPHFFCLRMLFSKKHVWFTPWVTFLLTSALFMVKNQKWRHVTSRDVKTSLWRQIWQKCFFSRYLTSVQIWSGLVNSLQGSGHLRFCWLNMGLYRKFPPTFENKHRKFEGMVLGPPNLVKRCQKDRN